MNRIERTISIEDLVGRYPGSVKLLIARGLPCLVCGEPTWGTLEELARSKSWNDASIDALVDELNEQLTETPA